MINLFVLMMSSVSDANYYGDAVDLINKLNNGQTTVNGPQYKKDLEKFKIHLDYYNEKNFPYRKEERDAYLHNINALLAATNFNDYHHWNVRGVSTPDPSTDELDQETIDLDHPDMGF